MQQSTAHNIMAITSYLSSNDLESTIDRCKDNEYIVISTNNIEKTDRYESIIMFPDTAAQALREYKTREHTTAHIVPFLCHASMYKSKDQEWIAVDQTFGETYSGGVGRGSFDATCKLKNSHEYVLQHWPGLLPVTRLITIIEPIIIKRIT